MLVFVQNTKNAFFKICHFLVVSDKRNECKERFKYILFVCSKVYHVFIFRTVAVGIHGNTKPCLLQYPCTIYNIQPQTYNIQPQTYIIYHQINNIKSQTYNIQPQTYIIYHQTYNIQPQTYIIYHQINNVQSQTYYKQYKPQTYNIQP